MEQTIKRGTSEDVKSRRWRTLAKVKRSFLVLRPLKFKRSIATCQPSRFHAKPGNCTQDKSNFYNTQQRCRSKLFRQCLFKLPRDFVSFSWREGRCPLISRGRESCGIFPGEIVAALFPSALYLPTIIRSQPSNSVRRRISLSTPPSHRDVSTPSSAT